MDIKKMFNITTVSCYNCKDVLMELDSYAKYGDIGYISFKCQKCGLKLRAMEAEDNYRIVSHQLPGRKKEINIFLTKKRKTMGKCVIPVSDVDLLYESYYTCSPASSVTIYTDKEKFVIEPLSFSNTGPLEIFLKKVENKIDTDSIRFMEIIDPLSGILVGKYSDIFNNDTYSPQDTMNFLFGKGFDNWVDSLEKFKKLKSNVSRLEDPAFNMFV